MRKLLPSVIAVLALAALVGFSVASASAAGGHKRPTKRDQSLRDGCQRPAFTDIVLVNSPEWVYVNRDPSIHFAQGVSRVPHPTPVDEPGTHTWFDFNANLVPDARYRYLIAGSPTAHTNNYGGEEDFAEARGRLHYEWEEGSLPKFAWPSDGDRTSIWGSWIWDCGHWSQGNRITGERTEFHPLNGIAVTRNNPTHARAGERETDFYVGSDGTYAHTTEQCALHMKPQSNGTYGPGFFDCARNTANFRQKLARSYTFFVPAPPRPRGGGRLVLRIVGQGHRGSVSQQVQPLGNGFRVTVKPRAKTLAWGESYFARWTGRAPAVRRLKVTFQSLLIRQADTDPSEGGVDPAGEKLALYLELNSDWVLVNNWAPSLFASRDNMVVPLNRTITVDLQPGRNLSLFMMGRECDGPSGVTLFGHFVPPTLPCPANTTESKISEHNNDDPGSVLLSYRSLKAALGVHTVRSRPTVFFRHTGNITQNDGKQGNDAYELTFRVSRVR